MRQEDLAELLGVGQNTVSAWERNTQPISQRSRVTIMKSLDPDWTEPSEVPVQPKICRLCREELQGERGDWCACRKNPQSLEQHVRKVRLDRGLTQQQVADLMGLNRAVVSTWERGCVGITYRHSEAVTAFLGGYPEPPVAAADGVQLRWRRVQLGLSQRELADRFGVNQTAVGGWERGDFAVRRGVLLALERQLCNG